MARIAGWTVAVFFVLVAMGCAITGEIVAGFLALIIATAAFPPLWAWERSSAAESVGCDHSGSTRTSP